MKIPPHRLCGALLLVPLLWGTGCRTVPRTPSAPGTAADSPERLAAELAAQRVQDVAIEQRVKTYASFATGISRELNEEPEAALDYFFDAAMADPAYEELVLDVSRRLLQRQEFDRAITLLKRATEPPDATGLVIARLGLAYAQAGKTDLAIEANRKAIRRSPGLLAPYQNLAQIYAQNSQPTELLGVLDEASRLKNADAAFLVDLAELFLAYGRTKEFAEQNFKPRILAALDRAAALEPESPVLLVKLADGYKLMGEFAKASGVYERLLQRAARVPGVREKLADIYLHTGDKAKAREQLEAISRDAPTNPNAYYLRGALAADERRFEEAVDLYKKAILFNPDFEQAYYDLAGVQLSLDRPTDALGTLDRASLKFKEGFLSEFYRAMASSILKQYTEALRHFTSAEVMAKTTQPERLSALFYFQFGAASERVKNYEQAEIHFRKCLELKPDFAEALNYLGYMWAERGVKLDEARTLIEKALQLEPDNASFQDSLGWVYFKLDQLEEALRLTLAAVKNVEKPDATIYDHLGDIYRALKRYDEARDAWRKSLAVEPSDLIQKKLDASPSDGPAIN